MKINIKPVNTFIKKAGIVLSAGTLTVAASHVNSKTLKVLEKDIFEYSAKKLSKTPDTLRIQKIKNAPSPYIKINGEHKNAIFVVDISQNVLYEYDRAGNAVAQYPVATGKKSTPTHTGIRRVSHVETFPFKGAPPRSKRRRHPRAYGPKIIILDRLNPETGEISSIGEFIHGNNDISSIGTYASNGCIRMDNEVIKYLSEQVKRGDIVIIKE